MQHQAQSPAPGRHGDATAPAHGDAPAQAPASTIKINNRALHKYDRMPAGKQTAIWQADPGADGNRLAYVHVPHDAPKRGRTARPPFTVTGPNGELLCSVQPAGGGVYDVYGGDGAALGRITRSRGRLLPWPRRVRWTVQAGGAPVGQSLTGTVGTGKGWTAMVLLSPLYFVAWAIMAAQGLVLLLIGEKDEAKKEAAWELEPPSRTQWRAAGDPEVAIDYRIGGVYRLASPRLDQRLAYAQAVLHVWDRG
ncbi:hypothetical protein H1D24_03620 [Streptomyces sp. PSKA28]|uniref:Uncharacterized protein n=1 Tax=Streptomyces himalayensis subsp. himalayensis TaxID=2756131 RepID=A0A7W0DH48_9ACTN|nr:hypothetical protein [Streptomyces himalayensis subsp. himalayensis]